MTAHAPIDTAFSTVGAVLFCCSLNAVRSPMAESMLKMLHGHRIYVQSAGARAGALDGFAISVMEELGIDISKHQPRDFEELEDNAFDLIIALSPEANHHALEMTRTAAIEVEYWNTFDPTWVEGSREEKLEAYRQTRDALMHRILQRFRPQTSGHL